MDTFGLTTGPRMDMEDVRRQLVENTEKLMGVREHIYGQIRGALDENAAKLHGVSTRIRSSIMGRLRQNTGKLREISTTIRDGIRDALGQNQAQLDLVRLNGTAREAESMNPPIVPYDGRNPQIGPPPGPTDPNAIRTYTILMSPDCEQVVAVPGDPGDWYAAEWQPPLGWTVQEVLYSTPFDIITIVNTWNKPPVYPPTRVKIR